MIRSAIRRNFSLRKLNPAVRGSSLPFLQEWRKWQSTTTTEQPLSSPVQGSNRPSEEGRFYGKISGFSKHALKTDIMNILEGCNVTPADLKFNYQRNGNLNPAAVFVQFPSLSSYDQALRNISKKGKLFRLEKAARSQWDPIVPYEGKVVALHGLPVNAIIDDIDRFLSGCLYYPGSIQFLTIQVLGNAKRVALVRFTSQTQAMNAYITKNRNFLLNQRITLQVLHGPSLLVIEASCYHIFSVLTVKGKSLYANSHKMLLKTVYSIVGHIFKLVVFGVRG